MIIKVRYIVLPLKHVTEPIDQATPTGHQVFFLLSLLQHVISCSFIKKGILIFFLFDSVTCRRQLRKSLTFTQKYSVIYWLYNPYVYCIPTHE